MVKKKVLVLGGTGFIGETLVKVLAHRQNHQITVIYRNVIESGSIIEGVIYKRVDISKNWQSFRKLFDDCNYLVILTPTDIFALKNILFNGKLKSLEKIMYASSLLLYKASLHKHSENSKLKPLTNYEVCKWKEEALLRRFANSNGIYLVIARLGNVYGTSKNKGFVKLVLDCVSGAMGLKVNGDGKQKRDFIFIDDAVNLLDFILNYKQKRHVEIFNICTGVGTSLVRIIKIIEKITGKKVEYGVSLKAKEKTVAIGNNRKIIRLSHYKIKYDIESGLQKAYENYKNG